MQFLEDAVQTVADQNGVFVSAKRMLYIQSIAYDLISMLSYYRQTCIN